MSEEERKLLLDYMMGNRDAARLCEDIIMAAHFWDDAIDRDKVITDAEINRSMRRLFFEIPSNPFMRRNFDELMPVMKAAARSWLNATEWEREEGACLEKMATAFAIRSSYLSVLVACAAIIGGEEYATRSEPWLREIFHKEGFRAYLKSVGQEKSVREGDHHVR